MPPGSGNLRHLLPKGDNTLSGRTAGARILNAPEEIGVVPAERPAPRRASSREDPLQPKKKAAGIDSPPGSLDHGIAVGLPSPGRAAPSFTLESRRSPRPTDGAFAIQFANGAVFAGCHHATCGGAPRWPELWGAVRAPAEAHTEAEGGGGTHPPRRRRMTSTASEPL